MGIVSVEFQEPVYTVRMTAGENRFNRELVEELGHALDAVEAAEGPAALVLTGEGKFFSNGFDLEALRRAGREESQAIADSAVALFGRLLGFGVPSAAALNGHTFGIAAMIALACDYRVMRADRGYFCLPEIDLRAPISPPMAALLRLKLRGHALRDALFTGKRFGGEEAAAAGIVDEAAPEAELLERAAARVAPLADKDRAAYAGLKRAVHAEVIELMPAEG